ncbi:HAMP domain-containing histidine kinase [Thermoleptolyngbya oregonensis NK1-22]|uniref:histidine kinase n=2 Tax=Thermoleptolyngbya TaxID=2303528 RepID=A0AA97BDN9_9CYAN|nr:HAMP domain-containing histidine kinase [Thermoleptolyngbya oregonensis NK1-22]
MNRRMTSPAFRALQWRLLLSSLAVLGLSLAATEAAVYQFVSHSLKQERDRQLIRLADAAAHSLPDLLKQPDAVSMQPDRVLDNDGDLDLPWQDLREPSQGIEWFNAEGDRLGQAGRSFVTLPLDPVADWLRTDECWMLTVPVYTPLTGDRSHLKPADTILQGYVRVSESIESTEAELSRLRAGLVLGGLVALVGGGLGSGWLTRQALRPIEQSFQQLKQFTADASHELRNPLAGIKTSVDVMQSHPERVHPADVKKLAAIASATDQMTQLVDDLLLLARHDGNLTPLASQAADIPLDDLLEDLVDSFVPQADAKAIALKSRFQSGSTVRGDGVQLRRLFSNLLSNAVQYTPAQGTIAVTSHSADGWAVVEVIDTGIGIAPEQISLVFDRFWRADPARSQREGGTGLGLAIAQSIAHAHHGQISVQSQLGNGSTFCVRLPTCDSFKG